MLSLALVSTLVAVLAAPPGPWQEPLPGLEYRAVEYRPDKEPSEFFAPGPVTVHAFRFAPERFEMRVLPTTGERGSTAAEFAREHGAPLVVNGGFFLDDFRPLGLLVSEGRELNPLRKVDWGVFSVSSEGARVVHRRDWKTPAGLEFAIESGPRLVVDGKPLDLKPQRARRTALGVDREGRVLVVVAEDPVYTRQLARLLARPETEGGLGCRFALNLDGGSSTQLWFEGGGQRVEVPAAARVANAVAVFPRP